MSEFEKWFMGGVRLGSEFDGERNFKNCSAYFQGVDLARGAWNHQQKHIDHLEKQLAEYREQNDSAREVIEFYGDKENWFNSVEGFGALGRDDDCDGYAENVHGKRARQWLKENK